VLIVVKIYLKLFCLFHVLIRLCLFGFSLVEALQTTDERPEVMRKQMTRVFDEILGDDPSVVYIGEDVQHGGYYLVTDGLQKKYPLRVRDFPPDETTLVGAAIGFSQSGLLPILEIPYAKYLDCGADMFFEAIIANWLSNSKQPNGMIIRLQGFDKGIFGGNFHTHNMLYFPPGLDVVCFSNGFDYARGMRYCKQQAKAGRVVMSVDSTDLLNRRHLSDEKKDEFMLSHFPSKSESYHFDEVIVYSPRSTSVAVPSSEGKHQIVIVTYGNGVPTSLLAQDKLCEQFPDHDVVVIETPCISKTPSQLIDYFAAHQIDQVVFADICKQGAGMPLASRVVDLQNENVLHNANWRVIGAAPTYNPLGTYLTFLSTSDILSAVNSMNRNSGDSNNQSR
jgi:pyruvate/2-oxoglutarate/acetoin dehydrogenase E1 component